MARSLGEFPVFNILQKITYYDGTVETYIYNDTVLYGYGINMDSGDEIKEDIKGFAPQRNKVELGVIGTTVALLAARAAKLAFEKSAALAIEGFGLF